VIPFFLKIPGVTIFFILLVGSESVKKTFLFDADTLIFQIFDIGVVVIRLSEISKKQIF